MFPEMDWDKQGVCQKKRSRRQVISISYPVIFSTLDFIEE